MFLELHVDKKVKISDDVRLTVNGEPVYIKSVVVRQEEVVEEEFDEELKEAYLAVREDRKEVMKEWDCTIADGLK